MKDVMAEEQNNAVSPQKTLAVLFSQTTEEEARLAVEAAAAVRPAPSIVVSAKNQHSSTSFLKLKKSFQKALKWPNNHKDRTQRNLFNPELLTRQKRLWVESQMKALVSPECPLTKLFEMFVVFFTLRNRILEQCSMLRDCSSALYRERNLDFLFLCGLPAVI